MLLNMVARNKSTRARSRDDAPQQPAVRDVFGVMHLRASNLREHLLEEASALRAMGKIREARGVEKRAAQVDQLVGALEADHRGPDSARTAH